MNNNPSLKSSTISRQHKLLFIVGNPRSGTKLLRHILNQNPEIAMTTNENEFLPYLIKFSESGSLSKPEGFDRLFEYLILEDYFAHRLLEGYGATNFELWRESCDSHFVRDIFQAFLKLEVDGAKYSKVLGDKSPGNIWIIQTLLDHFPNACFINIIRDPRAQAGSLKINFGKSPVLSAQNWKKSIDIWMETKTLYPKQLFELKYEDLTTSPEYWLRKLCKFIGVLYHSEMLAVDLNLKKKGYNFEGIRSPELDIFTRTLTSSEISQIESLCKSDMTRFGYNTISDLPKVKNSISVRNRIQESYLTIKQKLKLVWLILKRKDGVGILIRKLRLIRVRSLIMRNRW